MSIWVVEEKIAGQWVPLALYRNRQEARTARNVDFWYSINARIRKYIRVDDVRF